MTEKERIVDILNQWDNESYSTAPSSQVINKEAVPHIKEWCSNSSGKGIYNKTFQRCVFLTCKYNDKIYLTS